MLLGLQKQPILVDSGQYTQEPFGEPNYQNAANKLANELANQKNFTARVKITTDDGIEEHIIRTLPPEQGLGRKALEAHVAEIHAQNIQDGYLREREQVEEEIRIRQEQCSGSPPQPPQKPSRDVEL